MEIRISEIIPLKDGKSLVSFESDYGAAEALWSNGLPNSKSKYDVEIDIEVELAWSKNANCSSEQHPILEKCSKGIRIVAQIEAIENDGCCVLRIGDSILMTEIKNIPNLEKGSFIELNPPSIKVFASNL